MSSRAFITGLSGPELSAAEREFIRAERPWGFILFKRNLESPTQVIQLIQELRKELNQPEAPVLVDQEGGRVQRLRPPHWPLYPAGAVLGRLYDIDPALGLSAARLSARLIAADLSDLGITVDCLPVADVPVAGADDVIGDRAYGAEPGKVASIARAVSDGLEQGGVLPVLKHIPGHGRATADSHLSLPRVDTPKAELERTDFAAFQPLADLPMAMTAHVVFSALDPAHPATTSATIIEQVIRGVIGFQGLLMSDDVSMNALAGRSPSGPEPSSPPAATWLCIATASSTRCAKSRPRRPNCPARRWSAPGAHLRHGRLRRHSTGRRRGRNWMG
jgi:beta-N-acetylhexosaminidase